MEAILRLLSVACVSGGAKIVIRFLIEIFFFKQKNLQNVLASFISIFIFPASFCGFFNFFQVDF